MPCSFILLRLLPIFSCHGFLVQEKVRLVYLAPFRRIIPPIGMFDFSPIVAIFLLQFAVYGLNFIFSRIS